MNDSKDEEGSDVASTLSGLLAGLPTLAGPQRLASSLKQKFVSNSGESGRVFFCVRGASLISSGKQLAAVSFALPSEFVQAEISRH